MKNILFPVFLIAPSSPKIKKPTECPRLSSKAKQRECPSDSVPLCLFDEDCDKGKKCCSNGCTLKCLQPVTSPEPTPFVYRVGETYFKFTSFYQEAYTHFL